MLNRLFGSPAREPIPVESGAALPFRVLDITYPTISKHTEYMTLCPELLGVALKEVQRAWVYATLKQYLPNGGRILDLGGSACELADYLSAYYHVSVVDPYEGSGNGPKSPNVYRKRYPKLDIVQGFLGPDTNMSGFDAVVSTSVIEHIPTAEQWNTAAGIWHALRPGGYSIHAIDFTVRGVNGFLEHTAKDIESFIALHSGTIDIAAMRRTMLDNIDTYFLSPAMYQQWRRNRPFSEYPWRQVSSIDFVAQKSEPPQTA
jgi:hypothetical protein